MNQFQCMPELELETIFDLERDLSESSSTVNKEDRSNSQPLLQQLPRTSNGTSRSDRQQKPSVGDCANPKDENDPNQLTLRTGSSSVNCDIVVTVEPPQTKQVNPESCDQVVLVLEDDESLFNRDLNDYQETAL